MIGEIQPQYDATHEISATLSASLEDIMFKQVNLTRCRIEMGVRWWREEIPTHQRHWISVFWRFWRGNSCEDRKCKFRDFLPNFGRESFLFWSCVLNPTENIFGMHHIPHFVQLLNSSDSGSYRLRTLLTFLYPILYTYTIAGPTFDMLIRFDRHTSFLCLCREGKLKLALWPTFWLWQYNCT